MVVFAQKHNLNMVFETSAKTNYGMDDMIYEIALEIESTKEKFSHLNQNRSTSVSLDDRERRGSTNGRPSKDLTKEDFNSDRGTMSKIETELIYGSDRKKGCSC